jgi:hypothetical protein
MYPESNPASNFTRDPQMVARKRLLIAIGLLFAVAIIAVVSVLLLRPRFDQYGLTSTGLQAKQNFGYINDKDLYAFNGLAFYKTNLPSGQTTILSSGHKFPTPSAIYWANSKGALMNFSSSFGRTDIEEKLGAMNKSTSEETSNYTWYMDFASGDIKPVSTSSVTTDLAYYSETKNGFYYIPSAAERVVYFYDVASGQNTPISKPLNVTSVNEIQACPNASAVCLIGRDQADPGKQKLFSIQQNQDTKVLLESSGRIFTTNNPEMYLAVGEGSTPSKTSGTDEELGEADFTDAPAGMYNVKTKAEYKLDFNIGISDPTTHFTSDKDFYVIEGLPSDDSGKPMYRSGELTKNGSKTATYPMAYSDGSSFNSHVLGIRSQGSGDLSLGTIMDASQVVLNGLKEKVVITQKDQSSAEKIVKDCVSSGAQDSQYFKESKTFRIILQDDENFAKNIRSFSECIVKREPSALNGYNFQFVGTDPVNGRLSTD